jgi:hypothetical protein
MVTIISNTTASIWPLYDGNALLLQMGPDTQTDISYISLLVIVSILKTELVPDVFLLNIVLADLT